MAVPGRREYRLTLYPSRDRTEWRLVRVDWAYGSPTYTRVASGSLPLSVRGRRAKRKGRGTGIAQSTRPAPPRGRRGAKRGTMGVSVVQVEWTGQGAVG